LLLMEFCVKWQQKRNIQKKSKENRYYKYHPSLLATANYSSPVLNYSVVITCYNNRGSK
jgi:hypothetical protein